jgi:mRNA interferase RelE/StbE
VRKSQINLVFAGEDHMAWYRLAYRPAILQDLANLEPSMAQRLLDKTKWIASNIDNLRHEPIAPDLPGLSKYAVEDWRIFYSIDRDDLLVDIHGILRH